MSVRTSQHTLSARWATDRLLHLGIAIVVAALGGCRQPSRTLTIAAALLPSELPVYRAALTDFEASTRWHVVVVPQQYPDIRRALAAEAIARSGSLDLVELDVYSLALSTSDVLPFDEAALHEDLQALDARALQVGRADGLRFLPHRLTWQALIYNQAAVGRPPASWDELLAFARAHPQKIGVKGALYEGLTCDILPFVWSAGGSGDVLDDPGALAAFRFFAELAPYLHPQSATFKEATIAEAMARGEIVMHLNWPFVMSLYANQHLAPGVIHSAALPRGPHGIATVLGGGYIAIPRGAPHRQAAAQLARYLLSRPVQERFVRDLGWFSARRDLMNANTGSGLDGFRAMRDAVRPRPERGDYSRLSRLWQGAFRAVVFDGADPEVTLHAAQAVWRNQSRRD